MLFAQYVRFSLLVKFESLSGRLLGNSCSLGLVLSSLSPVILYYCLCQGGTSVVVLIVLCFGVQILCCLHNMCVFIF